MQGTENPPFRFFGTPGIAILGIWGDTWLTRGKYGIYVVVTGALRGLCPAPPPSGVGGTACVFPKSPVKGYFSCDKVRPENCKKGGYLTFHPEISFKKGVVFLSLSLWMPEKFKKGVIK